MNQRRHPSLSQWPLDVVLPLLVFIAAIVLTLNSGGNP